MLLLKSVNKFFKDRKELRIQIALGTKPCKWVKCPLCNGYGEEYSLDEGFPPSVYKWKCTLCNGKKKVKWEVAAEFEKRVCF